MNYIPYYRVSTEDQGKSGLGLASQKQTVRDFITKVEGNLIAEYQDIESGTSDTREGILQAIKKAKETGAIVVVKELSRITRNSGYKIEYLFEEAGVEFIEASSPYDPRLIKVIKLEMAKEEGRKIRQRTKDALAEIKKIIAEEGSYTTKEGKVIYSLGNPNNLTRDAVDKSIEVRKQKAMNNPNNVKAGALVVLLRGQGMSYPKIAKELNQKGFKTSKGCEFTRVQAQRLFSRYRNS